jgi:hypothetical protein
MSQLACKLQLFDPKNSYQPTSNNVTISLVKCKNLTELLWDGGTDQIFFCKNQSWHLPVPCEVGGTIL